MDLISKSVPFWGKLLSPKLSSTKIIDLIEPYLELSYCLTCDCSSYQSSSVFIHNLKSNLMKADTSSSQHNQQNKYYNNKYCNHCQHSFDDHVNTKVFNKPKKLLQEVVLKQDIAILNMICLNENVHIKELLNDVIMNYKDLLRKKSIPSQFVDISNDIPAEIPSIQFVGYPFYLILF